MAGFALLPGRTRWWVRLLFLACLPGAASSSGQFLRADAERLAAAEGLAASRPAAALAALPPDVVPALRCELRLLRAELLSQDRPREALALLPGEDCSVGLRIAALELHMRLAPDSGLLERWLALRGRDYMRAVAQAADGKTGLQIQKILNKDGALLAPAWQRLAESGVQRARAELYLRFPQTPEGRRLGSADAGQASGEELYARGRILAALGRMEEAVAALEALARASKDAALVDRCWLELGQLHEKLRDGAACSAVLERLLRRASPRSALGQQARFLLARNFYRRVPARRGEALPLLEALTVEPGTEPKIREQALLLRVGILQETSKLESAMALLEAEGARADSGIRETALEKLGWLRLKRKEWAAATEAYAKLLALPAAGEPRAAALYWSGRALGSLGQPAKARALHAQAAAEFPLHWYGIQSLERWKAAAKEKLPVPPVPPLLARFEAQKLPAARAAEIQALLDAGALRFAAWELEEALEVEPDNLRVLFCLAQTRARQGDLEASIYLAGKAFGALRYSAAAPDEVLKLLYPLPYASDLKRHAASYRVPPGLVAGLIHQESGFFSQVVSSAGAVGLMQLMPATARRTAAQMRIGDYEDSRLFDPEFNLRLGIYHLGVLLRSFDGQRIPTIASYNAGPQKVRQWWRKSDAGDVARFVEGIPYSETRDYVKKVLGKAEAYRRLYPELLSSAQ